MNSYNNGFTVPTLSLTSSRAKKYNHSVVPTRDYSQLLSNTNQNDANFQNKSHQNITNNPYTQPEKYRRPNIFPPKGITSQTSDNPISKNADYISKDLNKNVYLQSREQNNNGRQFERSAFEREEEPRNNQLRKSSSKRGLLGNSISSRIIEQQLNQRSLNRKADISKVLFDRRLSKLMEEANLCEEEMTSICRDQLTPHLVELQKLRQDNVDIHRDILQGLSALIK